ncbi:hypothetical protein tinsulaeT_10900 [Thalassotalea insulae]|uniref:Uncharacterized protein n=1 Tax=Thalassotalea insulae TaxID=2056778 RepID=A0ABQ6GST8_9GAMM|nr:hypothetical protein [Thalassotalea insulae]GLX77750.1 hypothetical protein tinsulaeT_10900 [Thalassotalea insulae]
MNKYFYTQSRIYRQYSILLLAVWLFALLVHNSHIEITAQLDNGVECHLCHNHLDKVDDVDVVTTFNQQVIRASAKIEQLLVLARVQFIRPQLRAPPLFKTL